MANCLVLTKVDADLASSAEQSTAQRPCRAAYLHPSGVAAGHEPLTMEPPGTAVRTTVSQVAADVEVTGIVVEWPDGSWPVKVGMLEVCVAV